MVVIMRLLYIINNLTSGGAEKILEEGLFEVVNGYGLMFEAGNEDELASLIKRLVENEDFYSQTATTCKKRSREFSIQKMADDLLKEYRKT